MSVRDTRDRTLRPKPWRLAAGSAQGPEANQFLAHLAPAAVARLKPFLEAIQLERREVLFRAHEPLRVVYFPTTSVVSLVARLESGEMLEVGMVGRDGLAGTAVLPGITAMTCDGVVQIPGRAYRMSADVLRRGLLDDQTLSSAIGRFSQSMLARSMQMSICNMFHPVEQRCVRWLLTVSDLSGQRDIPLTHDLLATMLGVHRPTVTLVVGTLDRAGLVDEARGRITIRDRDRLEAACCECYRAMHEDQKRLLGY